MNYPSPVRVLLTPARVRRGAQAFRTILNRLLHRDRRIVDGMARLGVVMGDLHLPDRVLVTVDTEHRPELGARLMQEAVGNTEPLHDSLVVLPSQQNPRNVQAVPPTLLPLDMEVSIVTGVDGIPTLSPRLVPELPKAGFY